MTRKQQILKMLEASKLLRGNDHAMSCQELCKGIIFAENLIGNKAHYLSGSISSILAKMVKDGELEYGDRKSIGGGHLYRLIK